MIRSFLIALQFLTRIPVRFKTEPVESEYRRAIAFYPVVGLLVGLSGMGVYFVSILVFSQPITVVFVLMFLVAITGALHEDGLADCADAFGGGYDRDQILKIMRDSHIGVFGALALVFVLWLKFLLLTPLQGWEFGRCLLLGQILSRWFLASTAGRESGEIPRTAGSLARSLRTPDAKSPQMCIAKLCCGARSDEGANRVRHELQRVDPDASGARALLARACPLRRPLA